MEDFKKAFEEVEKGFKESFATLDNVPAFVRMEVLSRMAKILNDEYEKARADHDKELLEMWERMTKFFRMLEDDE